MLCSHETFTIRLIVALWKNQAKQHNPLCVSTLQRLNALPCNTIDKNREKSSVGRLLRRRQTFHIVGGDLRETDFPSFPPRPSVNGGLDAYACVLPPPLTPPFFPASLLLLLRNDSACVCVCVLRNRTFENTSQLIMQLQVCARAQTLTQEHSGDCFHPWSFCASVIASVNANVLSQFARLPNLHEHVLIYDKLVRYVVSTGLQKW